MKAPEISKDHFDRALFWAVPGTSTIIIDGVKYEVVVTGSFVTVVPVTITQTGFVTVVPDTIAQTGRSVVDQWFPIKRATTPAVQPVGNPKKAQWKQEKSEYSRRFR